MPEALSPAARAETMLASFPNADFGYDSLMSKPNSRHWLPRAAWGLLLAFNPARPGAARPPVAPAGSEAAASLAAVTLPGSSPAAPVVAPPAAAAPMTGTQ